MEALFWLFAFGAVYSYFLYPLILSALPRRAPQRAPSTELPGISVIVTAHNEAARLPRKLDNTLCLDYPPERLEIIVASDASADATDAIAKSYADRGVRLVRAEERKGKEHAQLHAIRAASKEILVFSDVATDLAPDALHRLARVFADPRVGAVSSEDRFVSDSGEVVGEGAYVRYEMWLRRLESSVNSLVGLSGSFFAARKTVCEQWDIAVPSDFNTALNCVRLGLVAVSDPEVVGFYRGIADERKEYARKQRTVIRGMAALARRVDVMNPWRFGIFAWQVFSHKLMRWLVPWFLLGLLLVSIALAPSHAFYAFALAAQLAFYVLALMGRVFTALRRSALFKIPYFFVQANAAIAHASVSFLMGKRVTVWNPSKR